MKPETPILCTNLWVSWKNVYREGFSRALEFERLRVEERKSRREERKAEKKRKGNEKKRRKEDKKRQNDVSFHF
jgi:hypothetical protein